MNHYAEQYVRLVLAVGLHDSDYVDAYHGPPEWLAEAKAAGIGLPAIHRSAHLLLAQLESISVPRDDEMLSLRHLYLIRQVRSLIARVEMLQGKTFAFDEESRALYDMSAPRYPEDHFRAILSELGSCLPPGGTTPERYARFREGFIIPRSKLDEVFGAAIETCRRLTKLHIDLPAHESFAIEYVTNKSWSGYNWFKGNAHSLIQLNTDLPIYIDRAVDLGAHEAYPGHHVYNTLLEANLLRKRGWVEFSVYALFSPQSLIAEGTANYGIEIVLPKSERQRFEQDVLFPLAGLDPGAVGTYYTVQDLVARLAYAGNEAARGYLDGAMSRDTAIQWLVDYALMSPERTAQRIRFFEQYRSYVINYNLGQDLVKDYIEQIQGAGSDTRLRWREFERLLSSPRLPSALTRSGAATTAPTHG